MTSRPFSIVSIALLNAEFPSHIPLDQDLKSLSGRRHSTKYAATVSGMSNRASPYDPQVRMRAHGECLAQHRRTALANRLDR